MKSLRKSVAVTLGALAAAGTMMVTPAQAATQAQIETVVDNLYFGLLKRSPDAAGKAYWVNQITAQGCNTTGIGNAAQALVYSTEFHSGVSAKADASSDPSKYAAESTERLYAGMLNSQPSFNDRAWWVNQHNSQSNHYEVNNGMSERDADHLATKGMVPSFRAQPAFATYVANSCN